MQLQFEKRELACLTQAARGVKDQELTQEIRLTEDMPDAGRVLAGWGQVILRGKEWQGSHMAAAGGVQAAVLYAPEDGTDPRIVDAWIPFQVKWDGAKTDREGPMRVLPMLRFVDGRNLSARKILVRVGLSCLGEGLCPIRAEISRAGEVPDDVELLRRSYPVRLPREAGEKTFTLEDTLNMSDSVQQILAYTIRPELTETRVTTDKAVLRGIGRLHLVYRCREGRIRTKNFDVPFSQLAELERSYEADAQLDVMMAVTGLELDMEEENLALKCSMTAQYVISDRSMVELVEDAYSPRREVAIHQEELRLPLILDENRERVTAQSSFSDVAMDPVDAVFWPGFPKQHRAGEKIEMELSARFQLLGYGPDGIMQAVAAPWEETASFPAHADSRIDAVMEPAGEPQWITTSSGMEIRSEAEVRMTVGTRRGMPMITALELGPLREENTCRPTLILCRPGKRCLWELAKRTGSSVAAIRDANALEDEPEYNRMLLIPIQ